jgi:hypothetical protein
MPLTDKGVSKAGEVFAQHGGMLRTSKPLRVGIHSRTLYALRDAGEIEQVGRGLYRLSTAPALSNPDLVLIAIRIPCAVVRLRIFASGHLLFTLHSSEMIVNSVRSSGAGQPADIIRNVVRPSYSENLSDNRITGIWRSASAQYSTVDRGVAA